MLFLHEVHSVVGASEDEFERTVRHELAPAQADGDDARLLWYLRQTHGTGPAYTAITITAVRDGAAWERLAERVRSGDLRSVAVRLDGLRHECRASLLQPVAWSPMQSVELASVPVEPTEHEPALFMEDTAWPHPGRLDDYLEKAGTLYLDTLRHGRGLLSLEAAFVPAYGAGRRAEVVLWQRIVRPEGLLPLLTTEMPPEYRKPGTWMHDALAVRDRWRSRLLRSAPWSPLP